MMESRLCRYPDRKTDPELVEVPKEKEIMKARKQEKKTNPLSKSASMSNLIMWNISKALDLRPYLDLKVKCAIREVKQRLDTETVGRHLSATASEDHPEEQHLLCALLAWQQLGHHDADSLHSFIERTKEEVEKSNYNNQNGIRESINSTKLNQNTTNTCTAFFPKSSVDGSFGTHTTDPIVRLPVESVIMRVTNERSSLGSRKGSKRSDKNITKKVEEKTVEEAFNATFREALTTLETETSNLRDRAGQLARRDAMKVERLERAEALWLELEAGYQKQFALAQEKERDLKRQINKMIEELAQYTEKCTTILPDILNKRKLIVKEAREKLTNLETQVCDLANTKLKLSEEVKKGVAAVEQELCKIKQFELDSKFQEEQANRMRESLENEVEMARMLSREAERVMRAELTGLRKQIEDVSQELLKEDSDNLKFKEEHVKLRKEKTELIENLEGCKKTCDKKMQGQLDELKNKKELLVELLGEGLKCQCLMPKDAKLQVERTPSLAVVCDCEPEDNLEDTCSCTSLQHRLLSGLLADLFSGLQGELNRTGAQMPCTLLKCLQDNHNWDRRTDTKTNIRSYFWKLLKTELNIAIATSIEKCHAKWVGKACADSVKLIPTLEDDLKEGWKKRAIERRALEMAHQLAEQRLQERTEEVGQRTLERLIAETPPCACKHPPPTPSDEESESETETESDGISEAALYSCMVRPSSPFMPRPTTTTDKLALNQHAKETWPPAFWKQTIHEVTQLKQLQIQDLKKDSVKKEDLKLMKDDISSLLRETAVIENQDLQVITKDTSNLYGKSIKKETNVLRAPKRDEYSKTSNKNKLGGFRSSATKDNKSFIKKVLFDERPTKLNKKPVHEQLYAVNLCLCGSQKISKSLQNARLKTSDKWKSKSLKDVMPQSSFVKQSKPISFNIPSPELSESSSKISELCKSDCKCFRKKPSKTSIDNLFQTLATCKFDAVARESCMEQIKSCLSTYSPTVIKEALRILHQTDSKNVLSLLTENNTQVNANDFQNHIPKKNVSIITERNKNQANVNYINEDTQMKNSEQNRSFTKQPATTESEYMGTVYLDKSHENICKCLINLVKTNQEKGETGNKSIPFQCINTNTSDCTIYQNMHKDNKRSQTEKFTKKQVQSCQCQVSRSNVTPKFHESTSSPINSNCLNSQREITLKSERTNAPQKKKKNSSGNEYCLKFLGVTLDEISSFKNNKTVSSNVGDLIISEEKPVVCERKLPKRSSNVEQSNSLPNHNILPEKRHYDTGFDDCTKRESIAQVEEFTGFTYNFLNNKLLENTHKDKSFDTKKIKEPDNIIGLCISCHGEKEDNSGDLEVNAFHLLEDHIKQKLEDFKSFSCNICISPEEEHKFYSSILQRVKQVISDYANKMNCGCSKRLPYNGSWDRAYGLLQEYLKIKIKRVQCLCILNDNKRDVPEVLEKVCNLIENDFQRLRDFCTCKNSTGTRTKSVRIGDLVPPTEFSEKDTNTSQAKNNYKGVKHFSTVTKYSKQNSNNSMIHKENVSSQANPTFGMEAKSCGIIEPSGNRNIQSTETDAIFTESKSNGVISNKCDCCNNTDIVDSQTFAGMFGTKDVLVNHYPQQSINRSENCKFPKFSIDKELARCVSAVGVKSMETITLIKMSENCESTQDAQNSPDDKQTLCAPYIGFTVDCTCDSALGPCFCMKSVVQANHAKNDSVWKDFVASNNNTPNFSYIMRGTQNEIKEDVVNSYSVPDDVLIDLNNISKTVAPSVVIHSREIGCATENEEDIVLLHSVESDNFSIQAPNTIDECLSLEAPETCSNDVYPVDWLRIPVPMNSGTSNAIKLANSIYFPGLHTDNENNSLICGSDTNPDSQKMSEVCGCQKVPICHVKMLVEHIEKNLVELKCTCDSLISKVCPVHSKIVF